MSPTITPMIRLERVTRARASALGAYPSSCAASSTRVRVASDTGCADPLRTREHVAIETPAYRLMSLRDATAVTLGGRARDRPGDRGRRTGGPGRRRGCGRPPGFGGPGGERRAPPGRRPFFPPGPVGPPPPLPPAPPAP